MRHTTIVLCQTATEPAKSLGPLSLRSESAAFFIGLQGFLRFGQAPLGIPAHLVRSLLHQKCHDEVGLDVSGLPERQFDHDHVIAIRNRHPPRGIDRPCFRDPSLVKLGVRVLQCRLDPWQPLRAFGAKGILAFAPTP